jgi:hypothetical protein
VNLLVQGKGNRVACLTKGEISSMDLEKSCSGTKALDVSMLKLAEMLSI